MGVIKLSTAGIVNYEKYSNLRAGIPLPATESFDLLETQVLASAAASVTFSSLSSYAADFQHLQIRYVARTATTASERSVVYLRLNSDEANNYSRHVLLSSDPASSVVSVGNANQNYLEAPPVASSAGGNTNSYGAGVVDLLDPFETTKFKTSRAIGGYMTSTSSFYHKVMLASSAWRNTAAVTSIKIDTPGTTWVTGSRFSIYGLRTEA